eukprot:gnl/TRDRNA2_/TRDRNA2_59356_c0_seq1.p1 gnl/TRDRNA2_/TRDRNA2_59356_c0~~gnl/TRDRNA2_/TRDRNA2_59356_c0_seq1.p1  ORF type:complete len:205 (+),score=33.99 gnl/TRDRNA2_/TRDRNA2_59356_c0_seq1:159-773(+)
MISQHPRQLLLRFQAGNPSGLKPEGPSGFVCNLPPCSGLGQDGLPLPRRCLPDATLALCHLVECHPDAVERAAPGLAAACRLPPSARAAEARLAEQLRASPPISPSHSTPSPAVAPPVITTASAAAVKLSTGTAGSGPAPEGLEAFITSVRNKIVLPQDAEATLRELACAAGDLGPARRALLAVLEASDSDRVTRAALLQHAER